MPGHRTEGGKGIDGRGMYPRSPADASPKRPGWTGPGGRGWRAARQRHALGVLAAQSTMKSCSCVRANSGLSIVMPKFSRRDEMIATFSS
jgi:hypothetical protein